jgi:tRNA1Val (adenine37-N6)-methyltransferase
VGACRRVKRILDIGTGSGLVALMLAQRTEEHVTIDAVELDAQAQSRRVKMAESPGQRMKVECADVLAWAPEQTARYDLIVSNPPYYEPGVEWYPSASRRVIPVRSIIKRC